MPFPFSMVVIRSIHDAASGIISFLFMAEYYSIVNMCHIFFIHSSVNGHAGCFHVLAVVNSAAVNIGCMHLFEVEFSLGIYTGVGLLSDMVVLSIFSFLRNFESTFKVCFPLEPHEAQKKKSHVLRVGK